MYIELRQGIKIKKKGGGGRGWMVGGGRGVGGGMCISEVLNIQSNRINKQESSLALERRHTNTTTKT